MRKSKSLPKLSEYLVDARQKADISQFELARQLGFSSPQFVSNWERGLCTPPPASFPALIRVLKLSKTRLIKLFLEYQEQQLLEKLNRADKAL